MGKLWEHDDLDPKIREFRDIVWVEIGVRFANNAKWVLENLDISKIYLIDPFCELPYLQQHFSAEKAKENKQIAHEKLKQYEDKIVWLEDFSQNVHQKIDDDSVDILYIDGEHSYDAVSLDLQLFYSKVKKGGLVIGDDYNESGVRQAIKEFARYNLSGYNVSEFNKARDINGTDKFWFVK